MAIDLNTTSAPPRRPQKQATPGKPRLVIKGKTAEREESLNGIMQLATFGLVVTKQYADAGAVGKHGPALAHETAVLAESNERIAKGIDYLEQVGPYAGLITAAMPLVLQILANHSVLNAEALAGAGVVHPDTLAAQVQADMARQAAQALREQMAAQDELATLQGEMANASGNGQAPDEANVGATID